MESITLKEGLAWLVSGGGAGLVAYFVVGQWFDSLRSDYKRYLSIVLTALFAMAAWGAMIGMNYIPSPETWRELIESMFSVIAVALMVTGTTHGAIDLRRRVKLESGK